MMPYTATIALWRAFFPVPPSYPLAKLAKLFNKTGAKGNVSREDNSPTESLVICGCLLAQMVASQRIDFRECIVLIRGIP